MKKLLNTLLLLVLCLTLASCGNKNEYGLVEMSSKDLQTQLMQEKAPDFIFAMINSNNSNNDEFVNSLQRVTEKLHLTIYYVDYNHMDSDSSFYLLDDVGISFSTSSYHVIENNEFIISEDYTNYSDLYNSLKTIGFRTKLELTSNDKLKDYIPKAKEEYNNGNIGIAYNYLSLAWPLDEAKELYNSNNYYNLINNWEVYKFKDISLKEVTYINIVFIHDAKYYLQAVKSGEYENFTKPDSILDYERVYYYVKDDIIYTSLDDEDYKETYKINILTDKNFNIIDLNTNEEYEYIRGV